MFDGSTVFVTRCGQVFTTSNRDTQSSRKLEWDASDAWVSADCKHEDLPADDTDWDMDCCNGLHYLSYAEADNIYAWM